MGEYSFLLACSMTGGVVLAGAADLITLIVALETLTLPLYVLVGLRRRAAVAAAAPGPAVLVAVGSSSSSSVPAAVAPEPESASHPQPGAPASLGSRSLVASAEAAVTFLVVSVIATAVSLLGAALIYATTGAVHFGLVAAAFASGTDADLQSLAVVGTVLLIGGLAFKLAAVPLHAWAPPTYDGAPLPIAAYLSTASKLGGVVALAYVLTDVVDFHRDVAVAAVAVLALLTMTVGNLIALRQRRMVRLLAWSSIAQAGYILAALAVGDSAVTALAYTVFYVALELGAFGAVIALRGADGDGGELSDYAGAARRAPWRSAALLLALAGLAGLPPGIAGLFAKVAVVRALVDYDATWLAVVVALNAVIGLAYYVRAGAALFATPEPGRADTPEAGWVRPGLSIAAALTVVTVVGLVIGFAPQVVFEAVAAR
jgi:NADH-quinone oxidoreductase subunit N